MNGHQNAPSQATLASIRRLLLAGGIGVGALVFGVGGWATTAEFSGAVISTGTVVVESESKKVQHPTGGVVGELRVRDGSRVKAGDVVIRLDETVTRANLAIVQKAFDEALARQARLEAERDGATFMSFSEQVTARASDPDVAALIAGERRLFEVRHKAREGSRAQLSERIGQLIEQVQGLSEQISAKSREMDLIARELEGVRDLFAKKLVPLQRVNALERDATRLEGERGNLISSVAQAKGKMTETELQILQIDQDLRTEVGKELAEVRAKLAELVERKVTAEDQLKRIDIRAPYNGTVHQLAVHTIGGVISPGEPLMLIVPDSDRLAVETKIPPQSIDQVHQGQKAVLRFSAFNLKTTPEINGEVVTVSPDLIVDPKSGSTYYTTRIAIPEQELGRLGGQRLTPGMPVEAFIQTQSRTVLSYLTKPLSDQMQRAFRER
jgi:HlyD family secretion protein